MTGKLTRYRAAAAVFALSIVGGLLVTTATDATTGGPKTYTAVATTPALHSGSQTAGITLTNTSRNKISFNSINLSVPAGLTVSGPFTLQPAIGTVTLSGSTIQLRNLNTPQGSALTLSFNVTAAVQAVCTSYVFTSDVRQSNDFNGTLNKFVLVGSDATMSGPCSSSNVTCTAGDSQPCATGVIESTNGNTASVTVQDGDAISANLSASVAPGALTCAEYAPTSDQLEFDIAVTAGNLTGVTKIVTFKQHYDGTKQDWEYQACFQAPYDFPALLPSQLAHDFATGDFSGNTTEAPAGTFTGLLLPCSAGYGVPCLVSTVIDLGGTGTSDDSVAITVEVPALDPGMRF